MKKFLIIALALMLALALVACNDENTDTPPSDGTINLNPDGTVGNNPGITPDGSEEKTTEDINVPSTEEFVECDKTVFITADVANLRNDTYVSESTFVAHAVKDAEFKCIGYNSTWYKVEYVTEVEGESQTLVCYLHKTVAFTKDTTEVTLEEPITLYIIAYALNVRSYYDFEAEGNLMCTLKQGDEVTAVGKGDGWYKIQLSDDAEGNPVFGYISANETYVSTTNPSDTTAEETTAADEETTTEEATTEAAAE